MRVSRGALTMFLLTVAATKRGPSHALLAAARRGVVVLPASSPHHRQQPRGAFGVVAAASSATSRRGRCRVVLDAVGRTLWQQSPYSRVGSSSSFLIPRSGGHSSSASLSTSTSTALNAAVATASVESKPAPVEIFRKNYQPLPFIVSTVTMDINIRDNKTTVTTELTLKGNPLVDEENRHELVLDGDEASVALLHLSVNGKELTEGIDYTLEPGKLILKHPKEGDIVKTVVEVVPETNTQLSGLYKSGSMYCTQCEALGFRRITYYPDRPDNMAIFQRVRLEADVEACPILLSNGNLLEEGAVDGDTGRHYAVWSDPFPKPSYLFAAVAGNLGKIHDTFTTKSGRIVNLQLFSEPENVDKLHYALESLQRSMKWDEDRFGLEYDLDLYNIVAVDSFNMGVSDDCWWW